ncbi:hypothetical protein [Cerasicoccus arenae]|uniref:hypothetical protein n=1 Tax=Cerasicoccus arenae TaxID=424488 RepID=UPI001E3318C6|nr:hypothetical protein [Cerasicoccus arenae]
MEKPRNKQGCPHPCKRNIYFFSFFLKQRDFAMCGEVIKIRFSGLPAGLQRLVFRPSSDQAASRTDLILKTE